jgi:hypothetical protein
MPGRFSTGGVREKIDEIEIRLRKKIEGRLMKKD